MSSILSTLKATAIKRDKSLSPLMHRRLRLLSTIGQQIEAVKARQEGKRHSVSKNRKIRNPETGESIHTVKECLVRESFWFAEDGHTFLELRYGFKPLEIAKGKTTIDVGDVVQLIPTLEKLKKATESGEFDNQLDAAYSRLTEQLKGRKTAAK